MNKISRINKDFDLQLALTVVKKNIYIPLVLFFVAFVVSFLYLRYTKPVYESIAVIQRSSQDEGKRILDIEGFENESDLSQDVELLKSKYLLDRALKNLQLEISYYSEGEILTEEKYLLSSYHITLLELKDSSLIGKPIFVSKLGEEINLSFNAKGETKNVLVAPGKPVDNEYFNLIFKINNNDLFDLNSKENTLYFVFNDYDQLTNKLHPNLEVYALNPDAKTIKVSFKSNNHRLSKDIVSALINTFFQYDLEKKRESSASILDFIDSQLDTVFLQLKESETAIQSFKDNNSVADPEFYTEQILERTNELHTQLININLELELINDIEKKVQLSDRIEIFKVIPAVTGSAYETLIVKELEALHELLIKKEDLSYSLTDENDNLRRVERNIETQTENIFRIVSTIRNQLKFKKTNLQEQIYQLESQLYGIPAKEMELSRLNRMFNLNEKYYTLLIEKKTQYAISKAGFTMDNRVLQSPTDAVMISPNSKLVYILASVLAFLISITYLLIRYLTFNDIHEPDELKRMLPSNVGFLGLVPRTTAKMENSTILVTQQPKSALAESYRHIRSNLQFILDENKSNVMAISSSISGEGKTFIAANLAGIMAMSGKKVLVVDLDLRKPKVHLAFNLANNSGMSSILAGKVSWKECVQNSEIEGLDVITAGPVPPNPSELLLGKALNNSINEFKESYDLIIIDNPPVGIVSDGVSILKGSDCPIYVFRANYSKRYFAQRVNELIENNKLNKLFVILNGVELTKKGYGYGYGYGYGEYYSDDVKLKKVGNFGERIKVEVISFNIEGLLAFQPRVFGDDRGYFFEPFNKKNFSEHLVGIDFVQDNESCSKKNVVRGLHFQKPPFAQGKLVRVVKGAVIDIAVDIRKNSATYGHYQRIELSEHNKTIFWIPEGFAHGFVALEDDTIFSYKCSNYYDQPSEDSILWNDKDLNIDWGVAQPIISDKDAIAQNFNTFNSPF